jgi:hypothetical protein
MFKYVKKVYEFMIRIIYVYAIYIYEKYIQIK